MVTTSDLAGRTAVPGRTQAEAPYLGTCEAAGRDASSGSGSAASGGIDRSPDPGEKRVGETKATLSPGASWVPQEPTAGAERYLGGRL